MLTSLIGVVILLGGLIFFHELGHYTVAKLFGVKVEVFSLGFGKKIFRRQWGDTEYAISLVPLGGYVKLMGDDPYKGVPAADAERAFSTQKLYKRFLIVAAGPVSNLLLAYVLFTVVFWSGQPQIGTQIGEVAINSPAWDAGIRPKDRIRDVSGAPVQTWNEFEDLLKPKTGEKVELTIERGTTQLRIPMTVAKVISKDPYGQDETVGGIKGISPNPVASAVGISDPNSVAYKAGLRSGDTITKVETEGINSYEDLNEALARFWTADHPITLAYRHKADATKEGKDLTTTLTPSKLPQTIPPLGLASVLGMYSTETFVEKVSPGSPAEKGGLEAGDRVVKVGDQPVFNFETIVDQVQDQGGKNESVAMVVERAGKEITFNLKPIESIQEDPITRQTFKKYIVGFAPSMVIREAELVSIQIRDIGRLIPHAIGETNLLAKRMVISLVMLAVGKISVKNLGGPVLIATVAGKSLDAGIIPFLQMMALISINLFLLNLFPVPVLDGGHLFFFFLEAIKGKPVSLRTMEIANQIGMVFILMLVGLTLFNDISRIVLH